MKKTTLADYHHRVMKVVDYIWRNIDKDIDNNTLAEIAHFSPYHFNRIYRELMHETVARSVRRLRLHYAAYELMQSQKSVEQIAHDINYGSAEAFIRAFSSSYGQTPAAYRAERQQAHHLHQLSKREPGVTPPGLKEYADMYQVEIRDFKTTRLAGLGHQGDYIHIGQVFEKLMGYAAANNLFGPDTASFGVYYDDPASVPEAELRSHACISVAPDQDFGVELETVTLAGGPHAVLTFKGPYAELEKAYAWFYGSWLPQSGCELADRPPFEEYINDPRDTAPSELLTAIHLPLVSAPVE